MSETALEARAVSYDGDLHMAMARAKKDAAIDRRSTCFAGWGAVTKRQVADSMWLAEKKKKSRYI